MKNDGKLREILIDFACKLNKVSVDSYRKYYESKVDEYLKSIDKFSMDCDVVDLKELNNFNFEKQV